MNSLQSRLIVGVAAVFAVGFVIAGMAVYGVSRSTMYAEFDEALRAKVDALAALTAETDEGVQFAFTEGFEEFTQKEAPSYYEVWLDGNVLARSPHLTGDLMFRYGSVDQPDFASMTLPDGRPGRQVSITFQPKLILPDDYGDDDWEDDEDDWDDTYSPSYIHHFADSLADESNVADLGPTSPRDSGIFTLTWERPERHVTIAVARDSTEIEQRLANLLWILPSVGVAITFLSCGMLVLVVRRGLKPVESVTQAITAIDENSLGDRVPTNHVPAEIAPMVTRLNDLLERLDGAFHRERAFSSNLAHELRTPLAGLKSTLEVYLSRLHEPEEYRQAMSACLQICDQSQNLVENLLSLARVEGETFECRLESVNVDDIFRECWQPLSGEASAKELRTNFDLSCKVINTDREMLRVMIRNILSNAVCYCDPGGTIEASIANHGDRLSISVTNTGNTLTPEEAGQVFDRLWRKDQAREQTGEHFGLGLTLTKRFAGALGGSVRVKADELFQISILLPA